MGNNTFKDNIAPTLVLAVICLVVTAVLAFTYSAANPVIEKNAKAAADQARTEVLPEGDAFTPYDGKLATGVTECYMADNKAGMAVTATASSFGGTLTTMVGIDAEGKIVGVKVTGHSDTPGLGTKVTDDAEYLSQYNGLTEVNQDHIKNDPQVTHITGATISSQGVYQCIVEALQQYQECGGVK